MIIQVLFVLVGVNPLIVIGPKRKPFTFIAIPQGVFLSMMMLLYYFKEVINPLPESREEAGRRIGCRQDDGDGGGV